MEALQEAMTLEENYLNIGMCHSANTTHVPSSSPMGVLKSLALCGNFF